MPLRVAMLTNTYPPIVGGVSTAVVRSGTGLRALGHQVLVVAPSVAGQVREVRDPWVIRVSALPVMKSGFFAPLSSPMLLNALRQFAPHVVHVHHPWLAGATGRLSARSAKTPLIFTYHTKYEAFAHVAGPGVDTDAVGARAVAVADDFVRTVDVTIAPSVSTARVLVERGHDARKIRICPGGVDVAAIQKGRRDVTKERLGLGSAFVFGHLGRLSHEKNLVVLSRAMTQALRRLPAARCVIGGDGPAKDEMQQVFADGGVAGRVTFLGSVTGQTLADVYSVMDLFVFTSLNDTQGLVLIEAMAAGAPVIAVDAPGARDVVDGANGALVENDVAKIGDQLVSWATNKERMALGRTAARRTAAAMSVEAAAKNLEAVYYEAIEGMGL